MRSVFTPEFLDHEDIHGQGTYIVFGSNTSGRHGAGLARTCLDHFGAVLGNPIGFQGKCYAIMTVDLTGTVGITLKDIENQVSTLCIIAGTNPNMKFFMTKIGTGIAGFTIEQMQQVFFSIYESIPQNIILPREFVPPQYITS